MSDILALADEIERAAEGSRELDARIALATGWKFEPEYFMIPWTSPDGKISRSSPPKFTTTLDAALSLVPDERGRPAAMHVQRTRNFNCCAVVWFDSEFGRSVRGDAKSLALALCAASLRAIHQGRSK